MRSGLSSPRRGEPTARRVNDLVVALADSPRGDNDGDERAAREFEASRRRVEAGIADGTIAMCAKCGTTGVTLYAHFDGRERYGALCAVCLPPWDVRRRRAEESS